MIQELNKCVSTFIISNASRVIINYRMKSVLCVFLLLILLGHPTLVFTEDNTGPTSTIKILPENTTEPREGDSVTLDCKISSIKLTDDVLWSRRSSLQGTQVFIVDENGLTAFTDSRFSVSPLKVVNSTAALYSHKITIDPVQQSDQGNYQCYVKRGASTNGQSTEIHLLVHRPDEFPVCFPDGPATVTIGSSLSCKTLSDTRIPNVSEKGMPSAVNDGWVTNATNGGGSPGQELIKTVTDSERGKTFHCFSISNDSAMALACNNGPLIVVSETTQSPVPETTIISTATDKQQSTGLSGADIAGIVIGVILLLIIIAVHTLCCRCNPKRWLYAKSYPFDIGSSFGASRERGDTELGNSEPQTNNLYSDSQAPTENDNGTTMSGFGAIENLQPAPTPDPWISEQPDQQSTDPKPKPSTVYAQVKTTPVTDTKEPTKPTPPAVYAQVNKMTPVTDTKEPTEPKPPAIYAQEVKKPTAGTDLDEQTKPPAVYAQVTKMTPETDTSELINTQPSPSATNDQMNEKTTQDDAENTQGSSKLQKIKNIKRFGQNRNGQVARPPKPEPVIIYAELDLHETGHDEVRPPSDDSQTIYAQINH